MEDDLPLCSNTDDILVEHYSLNLECNFIECNFNGYVTLSLNPVGSSQCCCTLLNESDSAPEQFNFILDCKDLEIFSVEYLAPLEDNLHSVWTPLSFCLNDWSLIISKDGPVCNFCFPRTVKVSYRTVPEGQSLLWVRDQNERPCVYTYGANINNRSLLPCQEHPVAMATWEASIKVEEPAVVLMSGDEDPKIASSTFGFATFSYYTKSILPLSTLALAVGFWNQHCLLYPSCSLQPKCRIFAPPLLLGKAIQELAEYLPRCLDAASGILGSYPYPRIDILIVPSGFGSLGMASPNIIFLSQSILSGDGSMCVRVAHEVAHGWFGLLIGAKDWSEEWLSEGFATFLEDPIHTSALKFAGNMRRDFSELRSWIRLKTLEAEAAQTQGNLLTLRPDNGSKSQSMINGKLVQVIKNGLNPEKRFLQVHYLKGFFLLKYMANQVGQEEFLMFLKKYADHYKGKLVNSKEVFELYLGVFPKLKEKGLTVENIVFDWLESPRMPPMHVRTFSPSPDNNLYNVVLEEFEKWKALDRSHLKRSKAKKPLECSTTQFQYLTCQDQLLVLLEMLLEGDKFSQETLKSMNKYYCLTWKNAEVRHRWCELVIKHKYKAAYSDVKRFLSEDLGMGIYLFNELLLSGLPVQVALAEECYNAVSHTLEPNIRSIINVIIKEMESRPKAKAKRKKKTEVNTKPVEDTF